MKTLERLLRRPRRRIVGLMSGTSADGVDAALLEIETITRREGPKALTWELLDFLTLPYGPAIRTEILDIQEAGPQVLERLTRLHFLLSHCFADAVEAVARDAGMSLGEIDAVASHGQTVCHFPRLDARLSETRKTASPEGESLPEWDLGRRDGDRWISASTLQIGTPAVLAQRLGIPVVSDFRSRDVAAGGTGAPLVPLVDHQLFADLQKARLVLNVGGIANVTALRPGATPEDVVAFDTGPGNMVIDLLMGLLTGGEKTVDRGGALARKGNPDRELVDGALDAPFFAQPPPRAAGRGEFGLEYARGLLQHCRDRRQSDASAVATATWLTAAAVRDGVERFILPRFPLDEVIVSGGGAHNVALMEYLAELFEGIPVVTSDYYGLDVDAKEAAAFAILAHLSLNGEPGNLPVVTGARFPVVLGTLTPGATP